MNSYERALSVLARLNDDELYQAYHRFADRVQQILSPEELETYCSFQQRTLGGAPPEEQAVADKVAADPEAVPAFQRYLSMLQNRQQASAAGPNAGRR